MGRCGAVAKGGEPLQFKPGVPKAPSFLDKVAKMEYVRAAKLLEGVVQQCDMAILATYAQSFSDYVRLTEEVKGQEVIVSERGSHLMNPKVKILALHQKRMIETARELGFSPYSRERLKSHPKKPSTSVSKMLDSM